MGFWNAIKSMFTGPEAKAVAGEVVSVGRVALKAAVDARVDQAFADLEGELNGLRIKPQERIALAQALAVLKASVKAAYGERL